MASNLMFELGNASPPEPDDHGVVAKPFPLGSRRHSPGTPGTCFPGAPEHDSNVLPSLGPVSLRDR
jgi:hypothetical protein